MRVRLKDDGWLQEEEGRGRGKDEENERESWVVVHRRGENERVYRLSSWRQKRNEKEGWLVERKEGN